MNNRMRQWRKRIGGLGALALAAGLLAGCTSAGTGQPLTEPVDLKPSVKIGKAETRSIGDPLEMVAEVSSSMQRDVVVKVSGDVLKTAKKRGDQVNKGDLLFELDPADVKLQQQKAEIALRTAQQKLKEGKLASPDAESLGPLKDQIELAQIDMEQIERTLDNYRVTAPASGILTDFAVESGMTVTQGVVGKIQQINPAKIKANLPEEHLGLVQGKKQLAFYAADRPGQLYTGKIVYLADIMDAQQRTYALELQADNAKLALKPGTKVQLRLTGKAEQEVLTIPTTAIIREESDTYAFIFAGGKVEKRKVQLGRLNGVYQEVTAGLKQGEQVVVSGQHQLKDQQAVDAVPAE
ncbi:efflux RND transporter periplasmic adaptor subunit [Paenibacillus macerans]|uniref:efflux RND transporter periplasmic adaptor subunit n=1 Tax=Paenibacillus macerans TaxID=44252 RepID=UPI003D315CAB